MLSKIISGNAVEKLPIEKYRIPSTQEIANIIEKKKQESQTKKILDKEYREKLQHPVIQVQQNYFNSLEQLTTLKQTIYNQLENQLPDLALSVCHEIIGTENKISPDALLTMLKKEFAKIKDTLEYEIKINPTDYETIIAKKPGIKEILKTPGSVKLTKDEQIERGECKIIPGPGEISSAPGKQRETAP